MDSLQTFIDGISGDPVVVAVFGVISAVVGLIVVVRRRIKR